jgi:hypothetical protein
VRSTRRPIIEVDLSKRRQSILGLGASLEHATCANLAKLPVPTQIHFADYLHGGFDKQYPDHLPPHPHFGTPEQFRKLFDEEHRLGHLLSPYTNPTWWCDGPKGPTFEEHGEAPLLKGLDGKRAHERYGGNEGFTKDMYAQAIPAAKELGVDPMVLVALSANETGWGRSMVAPHNLFNIKTHSDWNGAYTELNVDEVIDGKTVKEKSRFRSYRSYQESFSDFVAFLNKNPRYSNALAVAKTGDSIGFLKELHKAGYATDPDYSAKVASIFAKLATKTG